MKSFLKKIRIPRVGPAERVSLGLTSMVVGCVLVLDLVFNIFPDPLEVVRTERAHLSEKLAAQAATLVNSEGAKALTAAIPKWVASNKQLLSIAVRGRDGVVIAQSNEHQQYWHEPEDGRSTFQNVLIPLMRGDQRWGTFELSFSPAGPTSLWQWLTQPWLIVVFTLGIGGFVLFSLYLRRVFEYLDPQSVLPDRIRAAFDAFSEGVMVIDPGSGAEPQESTSP